MSHYACVLLLLFVTGSQAVFCGRNRLATSLKVLADGTRQVGCSRPVCEQLSRAQRVTRQVQWSNYQLNKGSAATYNNANSGLNKHNTLESYFPHLAQHAHNLGTYYVYPNQKFETGEFFENGAYHFDYIEEISQLRDINGGIVYKVSARRIPCHHIQRPKAFQAPVLVPQVFIPVQGFVQETTVSSNGTFGNGFQAPEVQAFQPQAAQPFQTQPFQAQAQPAASPVYYQGVAPGYGLFCFTDDTMVKTADGRKIRMDEITLKDWLLSFDRSEMSYTPMESWVHRMPKLKTEFLRIKLDNGKTLKLTAKHYIYKTSCSAQSKTSVDQLPKHAVLSEQVEEGDCLFTVVDGNKVHEARVIKIDTVEQTGIYAPMTASGNIVVNDVLASCHSVLHNNIMQKSFSKIVRAFGKMKSFLTGSIPSSIVDLPVGTGLLINMMDSVMPMKF